MDRIIEYNSKNIGVKIMRIRDIKRITQVQLSEMSKVGTSTITDLESGVDRAYTIDTLEKIATALDVELDDLIFDNLTANKNYLDIDDDHRMRLFDTLVSLSDEQIRKFEKILGHYIELKNELSKTK